MLHLRKINKLRRIIKASSGAVVGPPTVTTSSVDLSAMTNPYIKTDGFAAPTFLNVGEPSWWKKTMYLGKQYLKNNPLFMGKGIDFIDKTFLLHDYTGKYGHYLLFGDLLFDLASSTVMLFNPMVGTIMKAGGAVSDFLTKYTGMGTDNTNKFDAIMGSKALSLTPPALLSNYFTSKTNSLVYDKRALERRGGSYTGALNEINRALELANKEVGLIPSLTGTLGKFNSLIAEASKKADDIARIDKELSDREAMVSNNLNYIRYGNRINGYSFSAKLGGKLKRVKKINFHKTGGEIIKEWVPEIIDPIEVLLEGGNITNKLAILDLFKDYDLSNINIIDSLSPRVEGNNIYVNTDEDLIHELHHYTSQNKPNELYKDFYSDLNDDKITKLGGNLEFVSRTGDPSDFYAPAELEARLRAAKYKSNGLNYTKDFFKLLRTDENKYGYNMRDLLYMFNDENLEKLFNLKSKTNLFEEGGNIEWKPTIILLEGGKTRTIDELIEYAKLLNPRFILRLSEPLRYIRLNFKNDKGEDEWYHATHEMTHRDNIVYPMIQEVEGKLKRFENEDEAYNNAVNNNNILKFNSTEEAELFSKSGEDELGNLFGYKKGWVDFFKQDPTKIKAESELNLFKEGGKSKEIKESLKADETSLKNIIPEGALHAHKHNMENADNLTKKGIPVVDDEGNLLAEIERDEWTISLELTKTLENLYSLYNEDVSQAKKDEIATEAGKLLVHEILENTIDRTGLIAKCENGGVIDGTK